MKGPKALVHTLVVGGSLHGAAPSVAIHAAEAPSQSFDKCAREFAAKPTEAASAQCFYDVARSRNQWDQAAQWLRRLAGRHPEENWITLNLAYVEWQRGSEAVESLMVAARDGFVALGNVEGEISARSALRNLYTRHGEGQDAQTEADRLLVLADRTQKPEFRVKALTNHAHHLAVALRDLRAAYRILRSAEADLDHIESYWTKFALLKALADVCYDLGRLKRAHSYLRRLKRLVEARADPWGTAYTQMSIEVVRLSQLERRADPAVRLAVLRSVLQGLEQLEQNNVSNLEANYRYLAGSLMVHDVAQATDARRHLEKCIAIAAKERAAMIHGACLGRLAILIAHSDPERAVNLVNQAAALAEGEMSQQRIADAWRAQSKVAWKVLTATTALSVSLAMLDSLEVVRELQPPGAGRTEAFSRWAPDYRWVAGRVLEARRDLGSESLPVAFWVMERQRARSLLEMREASRVRPAADHPRRGELDAVLRKLAVAQRQRYGVGLSSLEQKNLDKDIQSLEFSAEDLREQIGADVAESIRRPRWTFATIVDVQQALQPNEAMVLYQLGLSEDLYGEPAGGGWVWVISRAGVTVDPIPDLVELEPKIQMYLGLFQRRDDDFTEASQELYRVLMAKVLAGLSTDVERLFVVPDASLHQLPFSALVDGQGVALAERLALSLVPSASFWLGQRRSSKSMVGRSVLAFVDPERTPDPQPTKARDALALLVEPLGSLPFARQEGREAVSLLGGRSRLREGRDASEASFKRDIVDPFRIIHIAAHAVVDDVSPERSALILAPGDEHEDGLLQDREILDLDFRGRLVVLASCRSAGGTVIDGEGVLSLARTFLSAGAAAVVGSRWPLRDDDALATFRHFYASVGQGDDLGTAAQKARRSAIAEGRPAAAWAGIVVLGDSSIVPFERGSPGYRSSCRTWGVIVLVAVVALWAIGRRRCSIRRT